MVLPVDRFGQPVTLRSPRQASRVLGFDQPRFSTDPTATATPRPKFLFYVNFVRSDVRGGVLPATSQFPWQQTSVANWRNGLGFAVKSVDRPTIAPETQELSQYNKKRIINTAIRYQPVTINFYDTVDNKLMQLWDDYGRWHYGDFNQPATSWDYDITLPFSDSGRGFGFAPIMDSTATGINTSFFFDRIEIFQVFGLTYVQYDLIHPKIVSFAGDELDYEQSASGIIRMTVNYEAIVLHNNCQPSPIAAQDSAISSVFGAAGNATQVNGAAGQFDGETFDPPGTVPNLPPLQSQMASSGGIASPNSLASPIESLLGIATDISGAPTNGTVGFAQSATSGGALSQFGNFVFGPGQTTTNLLLSRVATGNFSNLGQAALSSLGFGNIANALSTQNPGRALTSTLLSSLPGPIGGISSQLYDQASGAVGVGTSSLSGQKSISGGQALAQGIAAAVLSAGIGSNTSTSNIVTRDPSGITLTAAGYGAVNANRTTSSLGVKSPF